MYFKESKRTQAFPATRQMEVVVVKELPRRRAVSHGFLQKLALCLHFREALYKRETLVILEWSPCLWRQGEPKYLQIWRSESPLLAQVDLVSKNAWRERENQMVLTLRSSCLFILFLWKML